MEAGPSSERHPQDRRRAAVDDKQPVPPTACPTRPRSHTTACARPACAPPPQARTRCRSPSASPALSCADHDDGRNETTNSTGPETVFLVVSLLSDNRSITRSTRPARATPAAPSEHHHPIPLTPTAGAWPGHGQRTSVRAAPVRPLLQRAVLRPPVKQPLTRGSVRS